MSASLPGALIALWSVLVALNWIADPEHARRMRLVQDALRLWLAAPLSVDAALSAAPPHVRAVVSVAAGLLAARLAGALPARWFRSRGGPLRLGFGMGVGSLGMLGLGLAGLWQPPVFWIATLILAVGVPMARVAGRGSRTVEQSPLRSATLSRTGPVPQESLFPRWVWGSVVAMAGASAMVNVLGALAPETGYDSLIQHLADPRDYLAEHRVRFNDLTFLGQHPAGIEMLYAWLLPAGGDEAARVLHCAFGLATAWAARAYARRFLAPRDATVLACLLYLTPFTGILSARSYIDLGLMFYAALTVLAPWGSWAQGAMIGLGIGTKYLGGFLLLGWAAAFLHRRRSAAAWRVAAGAALVGGWWGARNWLNTGNPVYPFGWSVLGGLGWDARSAAEYGAELGSYGRVTGLAGHLAIPWGATVHDRGALDDGSLGPLWLMLPALLLLRRGAAGRVSALGLASAASWGLWLASPRQVRYALMLLPLTLAAAVPILGRARATWPSGWGAAAAALPLVLGAQWLVSFAALYVWVNPLFVVAGVHSPESYLSHIVEPRDERTGRSNYMALGAWLPGLVGPGGRTYMLGDAKVYYLPGRWAVNALFNPPLLKRLAAASGDAGRVAVRLRQRGITRVLYNAGGSIHIEYTHHLFAWTPREFAVVEDLFRTRLKPLGTRFTSAGEPQYMLFMLAPGRHPDPPYLPGLDTRLAGVEESMANGRRAEARDRAEALRREFPESAWLRGRLAAALRPSVH